MTREEFEKIIEKMGETYPWRHEVNFVLQADAEQRQVIEAQTKELAKLKSDISHWTLERFNQQIQDIQRLREALSSILYGLAVETSPCRFDHHGNCQEHFLANPCTVSAAQRVLEETK